ncbi:MAG: 4Fe-4S dicluster domain-containing protein [Bacteroidetes bacterium]|nr:4Fe-4S dicluster domain-containing protein [Bacteroidota bacterium]
MRVVKFEKKNTEKLFDVLSRFGEVWSPMEKGESYSYQKIEDSNNFIFHEEVTRTILPEKKLLLPQKFPTLKFNSKKYEKPNEEIPTKILFGIHNCGISALNILDEFYTTDFVDADYQQRRNKLIIVGVSCIADEHCFCNKTNTNIVEKGYDIFFADLLDYYLVWIGTSKGDDIIRMGEDMGIFDANIPGDVTNKYAEYRKRNRESYCNDIDLEGSTDLMELSHDAEFWQELGDICLSCGQCTMVCPTCTCYNVIDEIDLNKDTGQRIRYWDSCLFKDFSLTAGDHNFRAARSERLKLWYTHKLKAFIGKFGAPSCVGCGRCIVTCPVDINIKTVAEKLKKKRAL